MLLCFSSIYMLHVLSRNQANYVCFQGLSRDFEKKKHCGYKLGTSPLTEYTEKYGNRPIWADYRRNHKGGIPPQKTRKTCIRGNKISGNPCPVCRDPKIIVDYRNIKLLDQFISSHTGVVHDTTKTGLCRKQQKSLVKEIEKARGHGLIPYQVPFVEFRIENYTNLHSAVNKTPSAPGVNESTSWYFWYDWNEPPEKEIAKLHKIYHKYVKDTSN
ncbi:28S ribosomal protein S18b, mitochondrial isoform X3 [Erpetoichthys calabaricus]|uniref:28S ribosomal protein S18b, mitochondrial isoform X3 n=1 Tax=Erpetoichthys calabaricus TaxID=27687 RepID=UPI002234B21B|nr:28S ribosomal protein S18b, mitochondrial isoform X3 [Erpetoichthys calabaricus]